MRVGALVSSCRMSVRHMNRKMSNLVTKVYSLDPSTSLTRYLFSKSLSSYRRIVPLPLSQLLAFLNDRCEICEKIPKCNLSTKIITNTVTKIVYEKFRNYYFFYKYVLRQHAIAFNTYYKKFQRMLVRMAMEAYHVRAQQALGRICFIKGVRELNFFVSNFPFYFHFFCLQFSILYKTVDCYKYQLRKMYQSS